MSINMRSIVLDHSLNLDEEVSQRIPLSGKAIYLSGVSVEGLHFLDQYMYAVEPFDCLIIEEFLALFINRF